MLTRLLTMARLRARSVLRRHQVEKELARELESHIAHEIDARIAAGMDPHAARRAALTAFGGMAHYQDEVRDTWRMSLVDDLPRDLRYSWRALRRRPMLVLVSALSIGLGVCVNATVFALARSLFLAPPTARDADRLVQVWMGHGSHVSYEQWRDLNATGAVRGLAGYQIESEVNWLDRGAAVALTPLLVTDNFFDLVGLPVARGRGFTSAEARAALDARVVVVSHAFWRNRLGGDSGVVGRAITLNARPYTIIGVLPSGLRSVAGLGTAPDVYLPLSRSLAPDLDSPSAATVQLIGRLHGDQSLNEGRAALAAAARHVGAARGDSTLGRIQLFAPARGLSQAGAPGVGAAFLTVLFVIVALVMAIACANVAGLLLARNAERQHEIALRLALGAKRGRLVRQLLAEGIWLALIGTLGGLALAAPLMWSIDAVSLPLPLPIELNLEMDGPLFAYAAALVLAACVLSALAPALKATRVSLTPALTDGARGVISGRTTLRRLLATGQVAVSLVLLVTAALFVRNLGRTQQVNAGFDTDHTVVAQLAFVQDRYSREARDAMIDAAVERVSALRGVRSAAAATGVPLTLRSGRTTHASVTINGASEPVAARYESGDVSPGYFSTLGIRVVRGREFRHSDLRGATPVAVVNEEFARRYLGAREPLGRIISFPGDPDPVPTEIVGVVANAKYRTLGETQQPAVFVPLRQRGGDPRVVFVVARTTGAADGVTTSIRESLGALDPSTAVDVRTMRSALTFAFLPSRVGAAVVGGLGMLGLVLAMVGLFGVISFGASRRTHEIAIRMSLGATRAGVMRLILREAAVVAGIGMALGVAVALLVTQPLAAFLVDGLSVRDPLSYLGTIAALASVAFVAGWIPAWRAARLDPMAVLRRD